MDEKFERGLALVWFIISGIITIISKKIVLGIVLVLIGVGYFAYSIYRRNRVEVRKNTIRNLARRILDMFEEKGYNVSPGLRVAVDKSIDNQEFIKFRGKVNHKDFDIYNKETDETEKTMAILAIVHLKASEDISRVANDFWYALSNGNDYTIPIKKR